MGVMVETNTTDIFIDKLKSYNDLSDVEFMDAMQLTDKEAIPKYRERINGSIAKIEKVKKSYDFYNDKFPNPVNLNDLEDLDKNSDEYKNAVSLYHGWNTSVQNAVYFSESFEDCMKRMSQIQTKFKNNTLLNNTGQREMGIIFQPIKLSSEIELLNNEIKSLTELKNTTEASKKNLKDKKIALKTLQEFKAKHEAFELFYNRSDYFQKVKKELSGNLGREATDDEINESIDKQLGSMDDQELQLKHISGLRTAFNEYIKHIANVENDTVFDKDLDSSFELLLDHYKLGLEGKRMVQYINTLHDPNNFSDLARRNQTWMKDIYNTRPEYYENMVVKPELKNVEDNALLNRLASRNIFVSEEELIKWREEGVIPTEFFDNTNKKVIPKGTEEYNRQVALFNFASELQEDDQDISNGIYTEELKARLDELTAKETEDIEALPKVEVKTEPRRIKLNFRKKFTINNINDELKDKEYVDVEYEENKELVKLTMYKDGDTLRIDNADGEEIILKDKKYDFKYKSGVIYKISLQADPSEVDTIKDKYSILRKTAIKESKAKPLVFKPITKDTPLDEYDENLQQQLFMQHEEFVKANSELYKDIIDNEDAFEQAFMNYVHTSPDAIKLVDAFNAANIKEVKTPVVEEEETGMNVGKSLSITAEAKFAKLGFTQEMIDIMSNEEIEEAKTFNTVDDAETMKIMLTNRLKALGITELEITKNTINKNDKLVAKKDVFIEDADGTNVIFVEANGTATITKINLNDNTVNLKVGNKKGVHTFNIDELNNLFTPNEVIMNDEIVVDTRTFKPTNQEQVVITESSGNVENFMDDSAKQKEIESKADKLSNEQLDDDILTDLDCI